jgi:hypothetical protein
MKRKRVLDATRKQDSGDILPDLQYVPNAAFQFPSIGQLQISESNHGDNSFPAINSYTQNVQLVMPQHANSLGVTFGVGYMDMIFFQPWIDNCIYHSFQSEFYSSLFETHFS